MPPLERNPFDRLLVAETRAESVLMLTSDAMVARYPGPVRLV
jgi:PIN domain nuclease of toxin-antitoxin system